MYLGKIIRLFKELYSLFFITDIKTFLFYCWAILSSAPQIIKRRDLNPVHQKLIGRKCNFKIFNQSVIIGGENFDRVSELYARKVYFTFPEFRLKKDMTVVDLGANVGIFTVLAALCSKRVVAVEAVKEFIEGIERNLKNNNCSDKVSIVWGIIGGESGMFSDPDIKKKWFGDFPPSIFLMEQLMSEQKIEKIDFLKVDIEGSEFDLFGKKENWFKKVHYIAMEMHNSFFSGGVRVLSGDMQVVVRNLTDSGFKVRLIDLNGRIVNKIMGDAGYLFAKNQDF